MKRSRSLQAIFSFSRLGVLVAASVAAASADPVLYSVTDLGRGVPEAINASGQVAGTLYGFSGNTSFDHAFLYSDGTLSDLTPNTGTASGSAINASGQIAGGADGNAIVYSNGSLSVLSSGTDWAFGINDSGVVVGIGTTFFQDTGYINDAFIEEDGVTVFQPYFIGLGGYATAFTSINDSGQIVGFTGGYPGGDAFLYSDGQFTLLGSALGPYPAINASGQVTFNSGPSEDSEQPYLYSGGVSTQIVTGGSSAVAYGLNDLGQVVGSTYNGSWSAFLYSNGVVTDLNSVIGADLGLNWAEGINDAGQIIAQNGFSQEAYLLTPLNTADTPEPASLALAGLGLSLIGLWRRQAFLAHLKTRCTGSEN